MAAPVVERRRWPRLPIAGIGQIIRPEAAPARLVDVSAVGVLLSTLRRFHRGECARLHTTLGGRVFQADVEVRHVEGSGPFRVGASFRALDGATSEALREWLKRSRT